MKLSRYEIPLEVLGIKLRNDDIQDHHFENMKWNIKMLTEKKKELCDIRGQNSDNRTSQFYDETSYFRKDKKKYVKKRRNVKI